MKPLLLTALVALLAACADTPSPVLAPQPGPDDAAGPSANLPYRPVMAGTASIGLGTAP